MMSPPSPSRRKRPKGDKRQRTRAALIAAAVELIRERGYEGTTLAAVAERAGMTRGAIYGNFKNRDELFLAVVAERWEPIVPRIRVGDSFPRQLRALAEAVIAAVPQRRKSAAIREHRIEHRCFFRCHFAAAERECETIVSLALHLRHARGLQEVVEARLCQLRRQCDGWHVARAREGFGRSDRTDEAAVEVFRAVRAERSRRVLEHRHRMDQSLVDRQCIDERLERGAGRAREISH